MRILTRSTGACLLLATLSASPALAQNTPSLGAIASQATAAGSEERLRALQQQADALAGQAKTLLGDLRRLELERDIQRERSRQADAAGERARRTLKTTTDRLAQLEAQRVGNLPQLHSRLVEVYKRGHGGYARLLLGGSSFQDFSRATRLLASLSRSTIQQLDTHRQVVTALESERASQAASVKQLESEQARARAARDAADAAVQARAALLADVDQRRDLTAQLASELDAATRRLADQVRVAAAAAPAPATTPAPATAPTASRATSGVPARGALPWPVDGRIIGRFGEPSGRTADAAVRNGIDIAVPEGTDVRASHPGRVVYADELSGFGTVVIVDHGRGYHSVYGYLATAGVKTGDQLDAGDTLGRVGTAPAGPPALYFEFRVDGRSVDPLQWLKPR